MDDIEYYLTFTKIKNMLVAFIIICIHWFADFVCQTDWQAKNKSSNNKALLEHTFHYSLVWYAVMVVFAVWGNHFHGPSIDQLGWKPLMLLFPIATFVCHTIQDYFTSRLNTYLWKKGDVHNFFVSIGFDQVLHYAQLIFTYYLFTK